MEVSCTISLCSQSQVRLALGPLDACRRSTIQSLCYWGMYSLDTEGVIRWLSLSYRLVWSTVSPECRCWDKCDWSWNARAASRGRAQDWAILINCNLFSSRQNFVLRWHINFSFMLKWEKKNAFHDTACVKRLIKSDFSVFSFSFVYSASITKY